MHDLAPSLSPYAPIPWLYAIESSTLLSLAKIIKIVATR